MHSMTSHGGRAASRALHAVIAGAAIWLHAGGVALAQDEQPVQPLPGVEITAPRIDGGPGATSPAVAETPVRSALEVFDVPASVSVIEHGELHERRLVRSMPDALLRLPGVMVQKTAPLQSSPYIRGFTGYHNLLLIDGVRLNNSAFRQGPNQYWSTVDPYTIERLEVVRGPHSVLYGSDAVGGTVNAVTRRRTSFCPGLHVGGAVYTRHASGESFYGGRVEVEGNWSDFGWLGGITLREYGNIVSGGGELPGTGTIHEFDADLRFDHHISRFWTLTAAVQHVNQSDAPRTEQTISSVPFHGTVAGSELQRDFDQERTLAYVRAAYDGRGCRGMVDEASLTLSWHRHHELRDRLRTGDRRDLQGFTLDQFGVLAQFSNCTRLGKFTYGVEWYHDEVDTSRRDFVAGVPQTPTIQGPLGDEGTYDLLGVYVQDHMRYRNLDVFAGVRFNYAAARADRVDNPAVAGSDPATPGNVISVDNDWTSLVGSLRGVYHVNRCWNVYGGVSQAFRTPTLHELTALEATSVVETPSPDLEPEDFVSFETGVKVAKRNVYADASVWYTILDNAIVTSPTGVLIMGTPEVRKDNIGDGHAWGVGFEAAWRWHRNWTLLGNASWMDSQVKEFDAASGTLVDSPLSREQPLAGMLGVRFEPRCSDFWAQAEWSASTKASDLSLRDRADARRIPPGGTPGWNVVNVRAGTRIARHASVSLAVENVFDENYRIHGSGQNETGRSFVASVIVDW